MALDATTIKRNNILRHDLESKYYDDIFEIKTSHKHGKVINSELAFAGIDPTKKILVLDAACGTGKIALNLKAYGSRAKVVGCDISSGILGRAKEKAEKKGFSSETSWLRCDCESLPLKSDTFDLVICSSSLHHFPNYLLFLKESRRILKRGGYLAVLEEPNSLGITLVGIFGVVLTQLGEIFNRRTGSSLDPRTSESLMRMHQNPKALKTDPYMFTINELIRSGYLAGFRKVFTKAETFFSYFIFFFAKGFLPKKYFGRIFDQAYKVDRRLFHRFIPNNFRATANLYCQK